MSSSIGGGAAFNAGVAVHNEQPQGRTIAQQAYLDEVADAAERGVAHAEQTIADLQASLAERRAEADRARAEADNGQVV